VVAIQCTDELGFNEASFRSAVKWERGGEVDVYVYAHLYHTDRAKITCGYTTLNLFFKKKINLNYEVDDHSYVVSQRKNGRQHQDEMLTSDANISGTVKCRLFEMLAFLNGGSMFYQN
jgi:hypothetical protein